MSFRTLDVSGVVEKMIQLIENENDYWETQSFLKALSRVKNFNPSDIEKLLDLYNQTNNQAFVEILSPNMAHYPGLINKLLSILPTSKMPETLWLVWFIRNTGVQNQLVWEALTQIVRQETLSPSDNGNLRQTTEASLKAFVSFFRERVTLITQRLCHPMVRRHFRFSEVFYFFSCSG
jgi:hypothetical protein